MKNENSLKKLLKNDIMKYLANDQYIP